MKIRKTKKGFTIVELVIVIAVIGVLTAILVPTFISLTAKANKASDNSLVANLNTALKMQEAEDGAKNATMHDAVMDLDAQGFDLGKLVTKSKEALLWNMDTNQFELEKADTAGANYWKIFDSAASASGSKVSVYAKGIGFGSSITLNGVGFDAGLVNNIETVNYTNTGAAQTNIVIRTNGGMLTVDAENDTVKHYGEGLALDIAAIAGSSYHEFGFFPKATIRQGRIVVENDGQIQVLDASGATGAVTVEKAGTGSVANVVKGDNANVTVAANLTEKIATVTTVTTWTALKTEVESGSNQVIKFEPTANQTEATTISVGRSVSILGNNVLVSGSNNRQGVAYNWQYNGLINITGTGITVGLDSLNLQAYKNNNEARAALNLCSGENDITVSNTTLTGQYAICTNLIGADNNKLTLNDVKFGSSTYCSIYWRASEGTVVANHTNFSSVNTANNSQSNGFGTIVVEFAKKNGVHSQLVDNKMENNTFTLNNCTITNVELGSAVQCVVAVYSPYNNIVNLNNCDYGSSNDLIVLAKGHIWDPTATGSKLTTTVYDIDKPSKPSKLYINGKDADNNLNVLHAVTIDCCIPIIAGTTNNTFHEDGCDYKPLKGYQLVPNGDGTSTYRKEN